MLSQNPKWEDLQSDLLKLIAKRLISSAHYISFRGVCRSWRSAATFDNFDRQLPRVPRLIYFVQESQEKRFTQSIDLETNTVKNTTFPPATDYPYLSCSGWILCLSKRSDNAHLQHFIRRENINLPGLFNFPGYQVRSHLPIIRKMVLSTGPDLVVMVIWGDEGQLGFCRPGDVSWSQMERWDGSFSDVVYHDRKLYAVDSALIIVECDIHGSTPTKLVRVFTFPQGRVLEDITLMRTVGMVVHNYLVKWSSGKFLIVCRYIVVNLTLAYKICEIDLKDGTCGEIPSLGGRCLFLGLNSSICAEFPVPRNMFLKRNCVYFTDTVEQFWRQDSGVCGFFEGDEFFLGSFIRFGFCLPPATMVVPTL